MKKDEKQNSIELARNFNNANIANLIYAPDIYKNIKNFF